MLCYFPCCIIFVPGTIYAKALNSISDTIVQEFKNISSKCFYKAIGLTLWKLLTKLILLLRYKLHVLASDGKWEDYSTVTVNVVNKNDEAPVFTVNEYYGSVTEELDGSPVFVLQVLFKFIISWKVHFMRGFAIIWLLRIFPVLSPRCNFWD